MKWFHNASVGKVLAVGFAIAVHGVFALGAYYLGLFISVIILHDAPFLVQPAAILFAALTFAGAMWGFVYNEYAKEDIEAYSHMTGRGYHGYLKTVQLAIAGDELASLAFRCYQVQDTVERIVVGAVGIIFLVIAFCLGKVIHAMANRPFEVAVYRARQEAGRAIVDDAMRYVSQMDTEQKTRFYNGDTGPIDEVRVSDQERKARKQRGREVKEAERETKEQEVRHERERARGYADQLLAPKNTRNFPEAQTNNQASRLSQNGRH